MGKASCGGLGPLVEAFSHSVAAPQGGSPSNATGNEYQSPFPHRAPASCWPNLIGAWRQGSQWSQSISSAFPSQSRLRRGEHGSVGAQRRHPTNGAVAFEVEGEPGNLWKAGSHYCQLQTQGAVLFSYSNPAQPSSSILVDLSSHHFLCA